MAGFVLSNLVGLVRQMLITNMFGTSARLDAFYAAEKLPNILFTLVAGGALASAFIPTFTSMIEKGDRPGAWKLASGIANLVTLILTLVSVLAWLFARPLVANLLASKFSPMMQWITVEMLRIMLLTTIIFGLSGLVMGILNVHQSFLLSAFAPTLYWLGMIAGVLFLSPKIGVHGLAWGAVLGSLFHLGVQLPGLVKLPERRYTPSLGLLIPEVREVGRLMAPRLLGVAVVQINFLVNVIVATGLPEGSLTAVTVAFQIMTMPQVVIAQAISIAALPTFSAQIARGEIGEMRRSLAVTLRSILFLSLPAALGLILLRQPVLALLFQRGKFDAHSVELTSWALLWFTVGLVGHSLVEILSRAFYALHDTKTPVFVGAAAMSLNVIFSFTFPAWFARLGWMPHGGLALANSLATALEMIVLVVLMRKRLSGLEGKYILGGSLKSVLAALGMTAALAGWSSLTAVQPVWLVAVGGIAVGGIVYLGLMTLLRVEELSQVVGALQARFSNSSG